MSLSAAVLDALVASGVTREQLVAVIKADMAEHEAREARQVPWERLRQLAFQRDGEKCGWCGCDDGPFEIDHVTPRSKGGENILENVIVSCRSCNRAKKDREEAEWSSLHARRVHDRERKRKQRNRDKSRDDCDRAKASVVTRDLGSNERDNLTSREKLPQEANASLPQGAKNTWPTVPWPCPVGVAPRHWADFLANRKRKRCLQTQTALDGVLGDIRKIADDEWPPGRLVEHAAAKGWASINDPRADYGKRPHSERRSNWEAALHTNLGQGGFG